MNKSEKINNLNSQNLSKFIDKKEKEFQKKREKIISENIASYNNLRIVSNKINFYDIESFDVETCNGNRNDFYLFGYIDKNNVYHKCFDKLEAINMFKKSKHRGSRIYATNLGFDFNSIAEGTDFRNSCEFLIRGNNYILIKFNGSYGFKINLLDSINYGGFSVEGMGKIISLPKLKSPKFLGKKPKNNKELNELIIYNKRDCEITKGFMELLQTGLNGLGGELKPTISSCALDLFRRKFLKYDVIREKLLLGFDINKQIYGAYYGGRTEVFKRGFIKNYFYYDFNSLYPSVMIYDFPDPMSVKYERGSDKTLLKYEGVSFFKLNIPYSKYPLLPHRTEDKKLCFPYGIFSGYYTHVEIRRAIELYGEQIILEMKDTVYYTQMKPFFKEYVNTLYNLRKKYKSEKSEMEIVVKLLLNSLYGRFALRMVEKTTFIDFENEEEALKMIDDCSIRGLKIKCDSANTGYFNETEIFDGVGSIPIWSVYTTAYARIKLHKAILECEPVYVDTDSLITTKKMNESLELGDLKLEKFIKQGIIIKPKLYFIDDNIKTKGIPIPKKIKDKIRIKNNILSGKLINYRKFVKIKEAITRDIKVNSIILQSKMINLEDTKRVWNGYFNANILQDSEPIKISEEKTNV